MLKHIQKFTNFKSRIFLYENINKSLKNQAFLLYFAQEDRDTIAYRGTSQDYLRDRMVIFIMVLTDKDLEVLLFVNKYKYVEVSDFKYLYNNTQYYQSKIKQLIRDEYLRKMKWYIVLGRKGTISRESGI